LNDDVLLVLPVPFDGHDLPIVQYADNTFFMEASFVRLGVLNQTLNTFQLATGLKVN
jgi:hypothetical protein